MSTEPWDTVRVVRKDSSDNINDIAAALAKAQGVMGGALKDSQNPFFKSKYADLEAVWTACRKPLADNGLSVIQTTDVDAKGIVLVTTLAHVSGQWIRGYFPIQPKDDTPQAMGSAMTYARRYALAAIVGVYQTDDDAEAAHGRQPTTRGPTSKEYVDRFTKAFEVGMEGAIVELNAELQQDQDLYREVWGKLPASMRSQIKEMVSRNKAA